MTPRVVLDRVYADFVMPSRLVAFRSFLESALSAGYRVVSIASYMTDPQPIEHASSCLRLILRHDIDTDVRTAAEMWRIERSLGVRGSYFFRLSTIDVELMHEIDGGGGHVGYHFEELATVAKLRHPRDRAAAERLIPEAREMFAQNLSALRARTGLSLRVAASHGDFVNRRLGLPNWAIVTDETFRARVGLELEAYDGALMDRVTSRYSDTGHPRYWIPADPAEALLRREPTVYVLVHPRHWRIDRSVNARDDFTRLAERLSYALPGVPARQVRSGR
ncbi:MAG: hypothetical protein ACYDB6_02230 [Candidatus Limnocylindrales bacterium]